MLVETSLNDSQVMYWEPAKYVAKLRALKTDRNPLLLKTIMEAGHGGASGTLRRAEGARIHLLVHPRPGRAGEVRLSTLRLFVGCVAIWGSTWLAITFQLGRVPPEASVTYRFLLASLLLFASASPAGFRCAAGARQHAWIALQGVLMFSVSYIYVYYAEQQCGVGARGGGLFGEPPARHARNAALLPHADDAPDDRGIDPRDHRHRPRVLARVRAPAAATGPRRWAHSTRPSPWWFPRSGSMAAHRNHEARLPLWQAMAWGMLYGGLFSLGVTLATGRPLIFEATCRYVLSLFYLAILGSIVAFAGVPHALEAHRRRRARATSASWCRSWRW